MQFRLFVTDTLFCYSKNFNYFIKKFRKKTLKNNDFRFCKNFPFKKKIEISENISHQIKVYKIFISIFIQKDILDLDIILKNIF